MVTGDDINNTNALAREYEWLQEMILINAIARECRILIDDGIAIEGPEFQEKSEEEMLKLIPKLQVISSCVFMEHLQIDWITR